jgi:sporulation protein YlmC with PRC-barrel domain
MEGKWAEKMIKGSVTAEDILGKDVIDASGMVVGVSERLYIDPKTLDIIGLSVDKGFLQKGFVVGKNYIKEVTTHAVLLTIKPSILLKGKIVMDKKGNKVGKVKAVELSNGTNTIAALIVSSGLFGLRKIRVPAEQVEKKEQNIILNVTKEDLKKKKV